MRVRIPLGVLYYDPLYPAGCGVKINSSFTYIKTNNTDAVKVTSIYRDKSSSAVYIYNIIIDIR